MQQSDYDIIIVGGGAAGFFTAINIAEKKPELRIAILERGTTVLSKVRVSGGGRCNVTHACFVPDELVKFYPRGEKELRGPFNRFCTGDTVEWFEKHGVTLKIEADGRMFPITDDSQTIIDCFLQAAQKNRIAVLTGQSVQSLFQAADIWKVTTNQQNFQAKKLVMASGSNPKIWDLLASLGYRIVPPVPSLFTFNIKDSRTKDLMGVSAWAHVRVKHAKLEASGPLLITHWGMSGPAILKLSAWGARELAQCQYQFEITVNWLGDTTTEEVDLKLRELKASHARKNVSKNPLPELPNRLWESLVSASGITAQLKWADLTKKQLQELNLQLSAGIFRVNGKSTFKEEFVTAGGIDLREINFRTMESKRHPGLYFTGEIINVDAITGGFNFQNAWTSGFLVSENIV